VRARIDDEVAVLDGPAKDHTEWHEGVADRRWIASLDEEVVRDPLNVTVLNVGHARSTETRDDVVAQRRLIASNRTRLVEVAGPGADSTRLHAGYELIGSILDGHVRRRAYGPPAEAGLRL
jgi:hypothetical protein